MIKSKQTTNVMSAVSEQVWKIAIKFSLKSEIPKDPVGTLFPK